MEVFQKNDRVQVFNLQKFECLGWGTVTETYITIPNEGTNRGKERKAVLVKLDNGTEVYAGGVVHIALSKEKATEIADRMLEDIEKAGSQKIKAKQ